MTPRETAAPPLAPRPATTADFFTDLNLWAVFALVLIGLFARRLIAGERFDLGRLAGEAGLAFLAAVVLVAMGFLRGLGDLEFIVLGGLSGLGTVRAVTWAFQALAALKKVSP